jgi:hypothetical protein
MTHATWTTKLVFIAKATLIGLVVGLVIAGAANLLGGTPQRVVSTILAGAVIGGGIAWANVTGVPGSQKNESFVGPHFRDDSMGRCTNHVTHHRDRIARAARNGQASRSESGTNTS